MSGPENYLKLFQFVHKNGNIWPENILPGPEFRLIVNMFSFHSKDSGFNLFCFLTSKNLASWIIPGLTFYSRERSNESSVICHGG